MSEQLAAFPQFFYMFLGHLSALLDVVVERFSHQQVVNRDKNASHHKYFFEGTPSMELSDCKRKHSNNAGPHWVLHYEFFELLLFELQLGFLCDEAELLKDLQDNSQFVDRQGFWVFKAFVLDV